MLVKKTRPFSLLLYHLFSKKEGCAGKYFRPQAVCHASSLIPSWSIKAGRAVGSPGPHLLRLITRCIHASVRPGNNKTEYSLSLCLLRKDELQAVHDFCNLLPILFQDFLGVVHRPHHIHGLVLHE
jgi:hypothetical protein